MKESIINTFGNIDIYLFDQLLKGRFDDCEKILDVGCGYGRNIHYFLKTGFKVFGVDKNEEAIQSLKALSSMLSPESPGANFQVALVEELPFQDAFFNLVISSAVFHFADSKAHFEEMLLSVWRVVKPGGYLFSRLASNIGIENLVIPIANGRYRLPDGSERYLVDQQTLLNYTEQLNASLVEPIKTTNVQNLRCMTTWCIQKNSP